MEPTQAYRYTMVIQWSNEDQMYLVHLPEFPWRRFHTHGQTYEEAARNGQEVIAMMVDYCHAEQRSLPEPRTVDSAA
ncbi:MAG: type II toxin-antitoxin system HicB family antitoxin [Cyanothece sp. SIO2G6]|nr:type II toxin-antitoxin system HicB family antitoxin [Cyanothece sp. SIO2G6]